jgi:cyclophilin family peptidyl-prolyl cis-trans isomerase
MKKMRSLITMCLLISFAAILLTACGKKQANPVISASPAASTTTAASSPCAANLNTTPNSASSGSAKQWTRPPAMTINQNKTYCAVVYTNKGNFTLQLFAKDAPLTVNNFVFLAKENYFNGIVFHRIIQSFMVQTGDPTGTGTGGPGYKFADELKTPYKYDQGTVAMANSGPNTNGSQFFVCTEAGCGGLNNQPNYSIFATVVSGMDTIKKIAASPVQADPNSGQVTSPKEKVMITSVQIVEL